MLEGLYTAAAGLTAQQQRLDAISNDVSNVSTTGYKRLRVGFRDLVYQQGGPGAGADAMTGAGAAAQLMGRSFGQGALRQTERTLDVAITGPGFLQVRRPDGGGVALTRDGALDVSADGRLRTQGGALLQPELRIPEGVSASDIAIGPDGSVTAQGRPLGRIELVDVPSPDGLQALGDNLFVPTAASGGPRPAAAARLEQRALEASNVDLGDAMVDMMDAQRSFQLASRAITVQDDAWGIANGVKR